MSGWIILAFLVSCALAALWLMRVRGPQLTLAAAFLLFGCAGYALQGHPGLAGSPRAAAASGTVMPVAPIRHAFFGEFTGSEHWLIMSESFGRRGSTREAVEVMDSAVREHPGDPQLWIGLGNGLMDHSGVITPASEFAYRRAAELAPGHPAPLYFYGLALARSGDSKEAVALWRRVLAEAPADASWRPVVENSIAALSGNRQS
jgi:hypothetical protein